MKDGGFAPVHTVRAAISSIVGYRQSADFNGHPEAGTVIKGSGGCRKVRWAASGRGKRGGARVIYFNAEDGTIWLLIVYVKAKFDDLPTSFLAQLKQGIEDAL